MHDTKQSFPSGYFGDTGSGSAALAPFKRYLAEFIRTLPHGARVLDVGCGAGKTIRLIQSMRPDVVVSGMDISDVAVHLPRGVAFTQGSVEQLAQLYAGQQFDAVVCQHVIEHLVYPMGLMEGIYALLRPGGRLFIETPNWTRMFAPWAHFYFYNDYTHVRIFSPFAMKRVLLEHGFSVERVVTVSSSTWLLNRHAAGSAKEPARHASQVAQRSQSVATRIFARLINPLMRDVLIAVATR